MSFLKEVFKSMARTIGRILVYALIGFLFYFLLKGNVKAADEYWVSIPNYNGSSYSNYVNNWPFTFTENALGSTCTSISNCSGLQSTNIRLTYVGSDILKTYMYDLVAQFDLEYIMLGSTLVFNEQGITCSFRYSDEIIPCGARIIYEQVQPYNTYFDKYVVHVQINITNVSPSINRSGIAIHIPQLSGLSNTNVLVRYTYTINEPIFRQNTKDNTDVITGNANANAQNIINAQNENTQNIISSQSYLNGQLIDNNNSNTQSIIDNQNSNTQDTIDAINNANIKCDDYVNYKSTIKTDGKYLTSNGNENINSDYYISDYVRLSEGEYTLSFNNTNSSITKRYCLYDYYKNIISCGGGTSIDYQSITINNENATFIRWSTKKSLYNDTYINGKYCYLYQERTNEILTDTTIPSNSWLNDIGLTSDTPITNLVTLPITLMNSFVNGFSSGMCQSISLGTLYGTDLIMPCIDLGSRLGSDLWNKIDILFSMFMAYEIVMLVISCFNSLTGLNDDFNSLYTPRHAKGEYTPRHAKE